MTANPFLGAEPYGAADRDRFFGRDELSRQLRDAIFAHRPLVVYGPSGAGKSSLMQAAVLPLVAEKNDVRLIRVERWPDDVDPTAHLASVLCAEFGIHDNAAEEGAKELVVKTVRSAARTSPRTILVYLDQVEQILFSDHPLESLQNFCACLHELFELSFPTLRFVLVIREDSLERFWNGVCAGHPLGDLGFRVAPLRVSEAVDAVEQTLALGEPQQVWSIDEVHALMLQVRRPGQAASDEAEVDLPYAQVACRVLYEERASGKTVDVVDADALLRKHLETAMRGLGNERAAAEAILGALVARADGTPALRLEKELEEVGGEPQVLLPLLRKLEHVAVVRSMEHLGRQYFELGREEFARYVFLKRHARDRVEKLERERTETRERTVQTRQKRRRVGALATLSMVLATTAVVLGVWAWTQQKRARAATEAAQTAENAAKQAADLAQAKAVAASDARLIVGFREMRSRGHVAAGLKLLHEVQEPATAHEWIALANEAVRTSVLEVTLHAAKEPVSMAAWSPDGKRIAAAAADGNVWIWSVTVEGTPSRIAVHTKPIASIAWSPDGKWLLTSSEDGTARLFGDGSDKPIVFDPQAGPLRQAVFSPDGTKVAAIAADTVARVWLADGTGLMEIRGHSAPLTSIAFMPDGQSLLTTSMDQSARITSLDRPGKTVVLRGHQAALRFASASPDGAFVVTTSDDRTARVHPASGVGAPVLLEGHRDVVTHAAWSPDGTRIVTTSGDNTIRNWPSNGKGETYVLSGDGMTWLSASFRNDGRYVLARSSDRTIAVWPSSGGDPLRIDAHDGAVSTVAWSPDGKRALSAAGTLSPGSTEDVMVKVWRLESLEALSRPRKPYFHSASILADGQRAVAAFDDRTAVLFRLDGQGVRIRFSGHDDWVSSAVASHDGSAILTTSFDKTARVWKADGKGEPVVLRGGESPIRVGALSPDGKRAVTVSEDKTIRIWKASDGTLERELSGHTDLITSVAWSPDGVFVLTTSMDRTTRVWRADGSRQPVVLKGHLGGVVAAAWTSDSARIVTASEDHTAGVWNAATGQLLSSLEHASPVLAVAWSPDEKRVVTSSVAQGLRVWKADGTEEPLELPVESPVIALMFVDDGRRLVAISEDDTIRTFTIDIPMLMGQLESANRDCLPPQERVTYLGETPETAATIHEACERLAKKRPVATEGH